VGNIVAIHGPQDGPLYMGSHIHQHHVLTLFWQWSELPL